MNSIRNFALCVLTLAPLVYTCGCDAGASRETNGAAVDGTVKTGTPSSSVVLLTDDAVAQLHQFKLGNEQYPYLKIGITVTGAGYWNYALNFTDDYDPSVETMFSVGGFDFVVEEVYVQNLRGTTIDWAELSDGTAGFVFANPNAEE